MNKISIETLRNGQSQTESEREMVTVLAKYVILHLDFWDANDLNHWQSVYFPELVEQAVKTALDKQKNSASQANG